MNTMRKQKGAIFLPFLVSAGTIVALSGMVVESTLLLHARGRLFDDAENAVLAAANEYVEESNQNYDVLNSHIKTQYCGNTFLDADNTNLDFSQIGSDMMVLTSQKSIPFLFLPDNLITLTATVAASTPQVAGTADGLVPLVVQETSFELGATYTLKQGGGDGTTGNYGALDFGGGASDYEETMKYGYDGTLSIGEAASTKTGNMAGPTGDGVEFRLDDGDPDNDIVLIVITADEWPNGASAPITIKGFAAFRITSVVTHGSHAGEITGEFVQYKTKAEPATDGSPDYGVYTRPELVYYSAS